MQGKTILDKESLLALRYSHIHSYLNYPNLTWGSTYRTNLKKIRCQVKHAIRIHAFFYKQPNCSNVKNAQKIKQLVKQPPTLKTLLQKIFD